MRARDAGAGRAFALHSSLLYRGDSPKNPIKNVLFCVESRNSRSWKVNKSTVNKFLNITFPLRKDDKTFYFFRSKSFTTTYMK